MEQKKLQTNLGLFLVIMGITTFIVSLLRSRSFRSFYKKSRQFTGKLVGIGGGIVVDYLTEKYLPQLTPNIAKVVGSAFSLRGAKGGKSIKRRAFKRSNKAPKLVAL